MTQVREADEKEDTVAMPPPQVVLKKGKVLSNLVLVQEIERMEEQKLKSKFPGAPGIELFFFGVWLRADEDRWQRFLALASVSPAPAPSSPTLTT